MKDAKRYRIEFSGKSFPENYPYAMTITAPSEERAQEWGDRQLEAWGLNPAKIRMVVTEHLAPSEQPDGTPSKKKRKKRGVPRRKEGKRGRI